jgi:hypothetical protein
MKNKKENNLGFIIAVIVCAIALLFGVVNSIEKQRLMDGYNENTIMIEYIIGSTEYKLFLDLNREVVRARREFEDGNYFEVTSENRIISEEYRFLSESNVNNTKYYYSAKKDKTLATYKIKGLTVYICITERFIKNLPEGKMVDTVDTLVKLLEQVKYK